MGTTMTASKLKAHQMELENNTLRTTVEALKERLERVADVLIQLKLIENTPYDRYKFVHGAALNNFPAVLGAEFTDVDGLPSV